ncbi:TPA: hypothetical protein I1827_000938 [Staphylococcus pseudintermedius]|nr:hypothetical protein [Staphylococcus pseudintermedius]EGQ3928287.1 hypothetical protein [Staphylococcus pseudintermedius]EGQ3935450.1 hypothetical protein [Staphylococcus pseudintermedius]HAR6466894.1 hypothetical protein [Staphylococcus pseudintermedius]
MYIVHDLYQNEIETFQDKEKAYRCYDQWKQNYHDDGWLPDESEGEIVVIAKVITSAKVVKDDIDDETGEQYYRFEDIYE